MADCDSLAPPPAATVEASPLLTYLAGSYAAEIAGLWPAPHHPFLAAPAARRHLICLWIARGHPGAAAELLLDLPLRRLLASIAPDAPPGTLRALAHIGEVAWEPLDYRLLLDRLADRYPAKLLRHAERIDPETVRRLSLLPPPLIATGLGARPLDAQRAALLADTFDAIRRRQGDEAAAAAGRRWGRTRTLKQLFDLVREDLAPELPPPPFPGSDRLKPLATKAAIYEAADRFDNCLRGWAGYAADGDYAFYEWAGPPGAVIELRRDTVFGWSLSQCRLAKNRNVPAPMRQDIVDELRPWGVHVGRDSVSLGRALREAARPDFVYEPAAQVLERIFAEDDD